MAGLTAQQIVDRIRSRSAGTWTEPSLDGFSAGRPDTVVTGIATSFAPSISVLNQAVGEGRNLIITQQPAFYLPGAQGDLLRNDPATLAKQEIINRHGLVVWRFTDNWNNRAVDGQLLGLAKFLGWDKYHIAEAGTAGDEAYNARAKYFRLPETTLGAIVRHIEGPLNVRGIRVIGGPSTKVRKASLSHGMFSLTELRQILKDPDVDLVVAAEAVEWESVEHFRDLLTWGKKKGMILLGRAASEDPGYGEAAAWLKGIVPEVPVRWIPVTEPFWVP